MTRFNEGIRWSCLDIKSRTTLTDDALKRLDAVAVRHKIPHPRLSAEEELNAAMLAVSANDQEQRQLHRFVDAPDSHALITASEASEDEEIEFE